MTHLHRRLLVAGWVALGPCGCTAPQDAIRARSSAADSPATSGTAIPWAPPARCFGDSPPETFAQDARPRDLFATGKEVLWKSGGVIHRKDLASASVDAFDASTWMFVKAADSTDVFGADGQLNITAISLGSGKQRVVSPSTAWSASTHSGTRPGVETLYGAEYVLYGEYVYVAWHPDQGTYGIVTGSSAARTIPGPHDIGILSRVKRDGASPPEFIGMGPDARFVLHDGYAYYGTRWEGLKRRSIVRGPAREVIVPLPEVSDVWVIGVAGGRVYFGRNASPEIRAKYAIVSVPVPGPSAADGGSPAPRVDVLSWEESFKGGMLDGKCVYAGGQSGVVRANLEDGTIDRLIEGHPVPGDATVFGSSLLATDGRYLYWAEYGGDRILRWSR